MNDLSWIFDDHPPSESTDEISTRVTRSQLKHIRVNAMKRQIVTDILPELPEINESVHIVGNGTFDYFTFVPHLIDLLGHHTEHFYGSTWTMNRQNVMDLLDLFDKGKIEHIHILTGLYFKRRESAVYAALYNGLQDRKQRYRSLKNHAKVMLFNHEDHFLVLEGSANFTANPRIEQTTIINNRDLWEFHKSWMDDIFNAKETK